MSGLLAAKRQRVVGYPLVVVGMAIALVAAAGIFLGGGNETASSAPSVADADVSSQRSADALSTAITLTQQSLRAAPGNWSAWAVLGAAYVQEGRITVDPSYYPKAEGALRRSMALHPVGNIQALIGLGALANARHEFATARADGLQAIAIDPYSAPAYGVLDDAYTQLGDYAAARAAVQHMLDLRPGVAAFSRASYEFEETGDVGAARGALERALNDALAPADVAFCRYYLGELAFNSGDLTEAGRQYRAGLAADPSYVALLAGQAKVEVARHDYSAALRDYATVVARVPQPQYILELAELQQSLHKTAAAAASYQLLDVEQRLFASNGVVDDLLSAQVATDRGDAVAALRHARAEWTRRHSVLVADALAWALHLNHRDREALGYARIAGRTGWRNALFFYHRAMVEQSLGMRGAARHDLVQALHINPFFSPLEVPKARAALRELAAGT